MGKYKITRMSVGFNEFVYTINRVDTHKDYFTGNIITDLIPVIPIRYYKTKKGAEKGIRRL